MQAISKSELKNKMAPFTEKALVTKSPKTFHTESGEFIKVIQYI